MARLGQGKVIPVSILTSLRRVAGALGQLVGAAWGLVVLNSLAAGALALAGSICMRDGRFAFLLEKEYQRRLGVRVLGFAAMVAPIGLRGERDRNRAAVGGQNVFNTFSDRMDLFAAQFGLPYSQFTPWGFSGGYYCARLNYGWGG